MPKKIERSNEKTNCIYLSFLNFLWGAVNKILNSNNSKFFDASLPIPFSLLNDRKKIIKMYKNLRKDRNYEFLCFIDSSHIGFYESSFLSTPLIIISYINQIYDSFAFII